MKKKINRVRLFAFIAIILETLGIGAFLIFYFLDLFNTKAIVLPEYVVIGATSLVALNIIFMWISAIRVQK